MGMAIAVSNGLFQKDCGTAAWIMKGTNFENYIQGSMITPGTLRDHSSFCSKAAGIYGILLMLKTWLDEIADNGSIKIACNRKLLLERLQRHKQVDPFMAHADLLGMSQNLAHQLGNIQYTHIKGHQDKGFPTALS